MSKRFISDILTLEQARGLFYVFCAPMIFMSDRWGWMDAYADGLGWHRSMATAQRQLPADLYDMNAVFAAKRQMDERYWPLISIGHSLQNVVNCRSNGFATFADNKGGETVLSLHEFFEITPNSIVAMKWPGTASTNNKKRYRLRIDSADAAAGALALAGRAYDLAVKYGPVIYAAFAKRAKFQELRTRFRQYDILGQYDPAENRGEKTGVDILRGIPVAVGDMELFMLLEAHARLKNGERDVALAGMRYVGAELI